MQILVVGIGSGVKYSELELMASYPAEQHVIQVDRWDNLPFLGPDLLNTVCNSETPLCHRTHVTWGTIPHS